ncbi:hypothetical protein [Marinomonas pollencensis]|uniref:Uncharacterized protein n=1 Tax=Marinomonas pollencensis TaxID=491954 RepID=A0A3E0DNK2_9GAMM|nr:hypothetical protein [Marinomonas pollencensis]REG84410.1 hypothetical protein DFP81_104294 [Marinomonas pollencensis]
MSSKINKIQNHKNLFLRFFKSFLMILFDCSILLLGVMVLFSIFYMPFEDSFRFNELDNSEILTLLFFSFFTLKFFNKKEFEGCGSWVRVKGYLLAILIPVFILIFVFIVFSFLNKLDSYELVSSLKSYFSFVVMVVTFVLFFLSSSNKLDWFKKLKKRFKKSMKVVNFHIIKKFFSGGEDDTTSASSSSTQSDKN